MMGYPDNRGSVCARGGVTAAAVPGKSGRPNLDRIGSWRGVACRVVSYRIGSGWIEVRF